MKKNIFSQWLIYKGACFLSIIIFTYVIYDIIYGGTLLELQSLLNHGDIIHIYRQSIACASGIPIFTYLIFAALRGLVTKGFTPPKKLTFIGLICGAFSTIIVFLGVTGTLLLPIGLALSPYSNCPQERLGSYYVIDLEICENINPKNGEIK